MGREGVARGDGGISRFMLTAGSWLTLPFSSASDGCNVDLSGGGGTLRVLVLASLDDVAFFANGEECRGSRGSDTTLLMGEVPGSFGDG